MIGVSHSRRNGWVSKRKTYCGLKDEGGIKGVDLAVSEVRGVEELIAAVTRNRKAGIHMTGEAGSNDGRR